MIPLNYFKAEVRKSVLAPFFLDSSASVLAGVAELAKHFESLLGIKYSDFNEEKPVELVSDYRLAKSFQYVLNKYFFAFRTVPFDESVGELKTVSELGKIKSYFDLRLFVFGLLEKGFTKNRRKVYERAEKELGASLDFDTVLWLDHPGNRVLVKIRDFDTGLFVSLYNLEVFETLFASSTTVSFKLKNFDKKIFWICKRNRLLFDIWKENDWFILKIFGPIELFGKSTKYGYRIAKTASKLIPYAEELSAHLEMKNKAFMFSISSEKYCEFVKLTEAAEDAGGEKESEVIIEEDDKFDSFPEQDFFGYFRSNNKGWIIEREPEPVLQGDIIFVPDFCVKRGKSKVFVEIIGFWTKDYQEKKLRKLSRLKGTKLILIVSQTYEEEAKKKLEGLGFPVVFCNFGRIGAITTGILNILEEKYSDFEVRYSGVSEEVKKQLEVLIFTQKYVLIPELKKMFNTFTEEEFDSVFHDYSKSVNGIAVEGVGFFSEAKLKELRRLMARFENKARQDLVNELEQGLKPFVDAMLLHLGYSIKWESLSEAVIVKG